MIVADLGTSWTKILNGETGRLEIAPTQEVTRRPGCRFDRATGHLGKRFTARFENELVALARGGLALVAEQDFTLVDVGSRDVKVIAFRDREPLRLEWSDSCGSTAGFTLELLGAHYHVDFQALAPSPKWINVTCSVFGIEQVFEAIINAEPPDEAIARFVHGLARNVWRLAGEPGALYLSGGLCENACFLGSLEYYARVTRLGRAVALKGLLLSSGA